MELGAVDFVSNVLTTDQQSNSDLRVRDIEPQQKCKQHAQSKTKSSQTKMPTEVVERELSGNGIWAESVLHKLLDALCAQHQALEDAYSEIEMEKSASADSIDDALVMVSRLQKEKFNLEMEHTQYIREAEEKLAHANETYNCYEDLLFQKNEEIEALQWQVEVYKHRFMTYGIHDSEIDEIELPATRSVDVDARSDSASGTEGSVEYSAVSLDEERTGNHDSAGFTAQNGGKYEKIWSKCNSSIGSCNGEHSATTGFSNYVDTNLVVNRGDGHAQSEFSLGKARERPAISSGAYCHSGWSQLCEAIEALQKRLNLLSEKKEMNSDSENELRSSAEELQSALTAYINSLRQRPNARQRMPSFFELLEAEAEEESDGFREVHVDTEQIRDLPQRTEPLSKRCEENGFSSECIGENCSLETYKARPRPVKSVVMTISALEFNSDSIKLTINSFNVKSFKGYAQNFHKWEEVAKGQKILRMPSLLVTGLTVASLTKCLLSGLFLGVQSMLSSRGYKRALHRRNYHLTPCKNVGLSNLLEDKDHSENL